MLRIKQDLVIEDLRRYPTEEVKQLRELLESGAAACPDPHRKDFYEVANGSRVFYIHVSPATGRVFLLATWAKDDTDGQVNPSSVV